MSSNVLKLIGAIVMGLAIVACGDDEDDEPFSDSLSLTTDEEVPVCTAAGADAMGSGTVTIDPDDLSLRVVNLAYSGLSGAATAGHIHFGDPGEAGPVILPFADVTSPIDEIFTAEDYPAAPPEGAPADFPAFLDAVREGRTYVNIHTEACAPGEIRAQID
ncbi:CHRD domain-containing protein [Sandaracinus amylolyticus]|nr:CHRD domain-containing protein [Sandaracinus amylolyticus]